MTYVELFCRARALLAPARVPEPEPVRLAPVVVLVRRPFDWQHDVPELRVAPRRVVERVVVDGQAFYVSHVEVER
jgi:hypothetical protein